MHVWLKFCNRVLIDVLHEYNVMMTCTFLTLAWASDERCAETLQGLADGLDVDFALLYVVAAQHTLLGEVQVCLSVAIAGLAHQIDDVAVAIGIIESDQGFEVRITDVCHEVRVEHGCGTRDRC